MDASAAGLQKLAERDPLGITSRPPDHQAAVFLVQDVAWRHLIVGRAGRMDRQDRIDVLAVVLGARVTVPGPEAARCSLSCGGPRRVQRRRKIADGQRSVNAVI
ncbi:hypothetical protein OG594_24000 [Streptomyces sp. NBC_01214]|uniref:hypothetical protein n=1 Tax=Streptomyces sp. NBC_01214 TaxID=2903777 RepID=UPI00224CA6AE|nr:hypothetical protein [Streptomyces sp. NBC_01214]MCX4804644.1 hypothetical protein [Streptomyces sp. NBC_01214]